MNREIILMRHGQPALATLNKVSALEMKAWIDHYNQSKIGCQPIPQSSLHHAVRARVIVSSSAPRALSSVQALGLQPMLVDAVFCEAQLPWGSLRRPRLSPLTWALILRLLWFCGYSGGVETVATAHERARAAAARLQSLATKGPVLLLGHGLMNRMIAKHLLKEGWVREKANGNRYWSAAVYRCSTT